MFKTKRFGMFIHWGLYSVDGFHEQAQWRQSIPSKEYEKYADIFNPKKYNPLEWVRLAKDNGVDYIVFTTKHHDGFCMWDTKYSDYKVTNTPYGRDVLRELSEACCMEGIGLSLYYSCPDWHHPNYPNTIGHHEISEVRDTDSPNEALYIEYVKNQITELLTGYGKILSFFWDISPKTRDKSLNELVRKLQPGIYINNRGYDKGDFSTPERVSADGAVFEGLTEACDSVGNESWGYRSVEDYHSTLYLTSSIDRFMAMGANYVLNVGPDGDGMIPDVSKQIFSKVGSWYKNVKEALYATPVKFEWASKKGLLTTRNENILYIHFPTPPAATGLCIENITALPKKATLLNNGKELYCAMDEMPSLFDGTKESMRSVFHLNGIPVDEFSNQAVVLKLEFDNIEEAIKCDAASIKKRIL